MMLARRNNNYSLWDELFNDSFFANPFHAGKSSFMQTDVEEKDNHYLMSIELPGFQKDDIHAQLKDGYLTITAEKKENHEEKNEEGRYIRRERYSGSCSRSFYVGESVKQEDIQAGFQDGVLTLSVPKEQHQVLEDTVKYIPIH